MLEVGLRVGLGQRLRLRVLFLTVQSLHVSLRLGLDLPEPTEKPAEDSMSGGQGSRRVILPQEASPAWHTEDQSQSRCQPAHLQAHLPSRQPLSVTRGSPCITHRYQDLLTCSRLSAVSLGECDRLKKDGSS